MSKTNLEVAKECGAVIRLCSYTLDGITFHTHEVFFANSEQLDAYTSRICAEKDSEIDGLLDNTQSLANDLHKTEVQLSEANALIAMQDEALKSIKQLVCGDARPNWQDAEATYRTRGRIADICEALSASAESVASWEAEKLEPLQRQVAMLVHKITDFANFQKHVACGTSRIGPVSDETKAYLMDVAANLIKLAANYQATALAYEREVKARALMDLVTGLDNEEDVSAWYVREQAKRWGN